MWNILIYCGKLPSVIIPGFKTPYEALKVAEDKGYESKNRTYDIVTEGGDKLFVVEQDRVYRIKKEIVRDY